MFAKEERQEYLREAKELTLIAGYVTREDLLYGSYFNTFDNAWELAQEFLEEYPLGYEWGIEKEFDEAIEEFVRERYINGKKI